MEPLLPGVFPGTERPHVILAQDIDWPPYAYIGVPPESDYDTAGFGHDVANGLTEVCDIDVTVVQTEWAECWGDSKIGEGLLSGSFHGCMTYTNTFGSRNRYLEFSNAILFDNKPAGILTRLGDDGLPVVSPMSNLDGVKIVDVNGWAPTSDGLAIVENSCTGETFSGYEMVIPTEVGNDAAMEYLRNGSVDAMWVYADQASSYECSGLSEDVTATWDCDLWEGLGINYTYIHTGLYGHALNGTTLSISKKGSGLRNVLDPCINAYLETESYYNICEKHDLVSDCYENEFFPTESTVSAPYMNATIDLTTECSDGYCPCS